MEKSPLNNYPQMPPAMDTHTTGMGAGSSGSAPPSYDQAMNGPGIGFQAPSVQAQPTPAHTHTVPPNVGNAHVHTQPVYVAAPQQPYSYPTQQAVPGQMPAAQVVIVQQPLGPLGPHPVFLTCPACHAQLMTRTEFEPNSKTHLMAGLLCLMGLWCCVCVPYCVESCMTTNHYCSNCNKYMGSFSGNF